MKITNYINLEFECENRVYRMSMPADSPLGEAYEATSNFMNKIVTLINNNEKSRLESEKEAEDEINDGA